MRKKVIAANWKMNEEYYEGLTLFTEVINIINDEVTGEQEIIVCCPFIHLHSLAELSKGYSKISVGAQNLHQAECGAFTGEISAAMIRSTGAEYVIVGHSERRKYFNETDKLVAQKTDTALKNLLKPIVCIGETKKEREANEQYDVLKRQLVEGIFHLNKTDFNRLIIAYEPIWAIGTGVTASPAQAQEIHKFIRQEIAVKYSREIADEMTILYGGSCNSENAATLFSQADIDGGLIGGASLKSRDFVSIIKAYHVP
ncbi:MAG TPA: triose-phosphate isomerase [Hanamia sp.]|nr:triose-phosphate isomerase [Hanamia sp.]